MERSTRKFAETETAPEATPNEAPNLSEKEAKLLTTNKLRCLAAIIACGALCVCVFLAIIYNLLAEPDELVKEVGRKTFRMFTVLSNLMMAISAAMSIPFAVEGLRHRNYHLPRWIVNMLFMGTTAVTLTFIIALFVLSPNAGFRYIMAERANIYLHTLCPLAAIALFLFINSDHRVRFRDTFLAILPIVVYATLYLIMVFALGEDAGGWRDHYQFKRLLPWYFLAPLMLAFAFGLASLLRLAHNAVHNYRQKKTERLYQEAAAEKYPTVQEAIRAMAQGYRLRDRGGDLTVPRRIILMLDRQYKSGLSTAELCDIYLTEYYAAAQADGDNSAAAADAGGNDIATATDAGDNDAATDAGDNIYPAEPAATGDHDHAAEAETNVR